MKYVVPLTVPLVLPSAASRHIPMRFLLMSMRFPINIMVPSESNPVTVARRPMSDFVGLRTSSGCAMDAGRVVAAVLCGVQPPWRMYRSNGADSADMTAASVL